MKMPLGVLAGIVGGLLLIGGILATAFFILWASIPDNQGIPGAGDPIGLGVLVVILGAVLCYGSWRMLHGSRSVPQDATSGGNPNWTIEGAVLAYLIRISVAVFSLFRHGAHSASQWFKSHGTRN